MRRSPSSLAHAFTLTELLVVMVVIVIVTGLVVPAVNSLGRSLGLVTGGNLATGLVKSARQTAISKNTLTALVVLANQGSDADFRAMTVLEYRPGAGGWTQTADWQLLPMGVVVDVDENESTFLAHNPTFPFLEGPPQQQNPPVSYQGTPLASPNGYRARIFTSNGSLRDAQYGAQIRFVEGFIQNGKTVYTRLGADGKPANYYDLTIIGATGVPKVSRPL